MHHNRLKRMGAVGPADSLRLLEVVKVSCDFCGAEFERASHKKKGRFSFCNRECRALFSGLPLGSRTDAGEGYVLVKVPVETPGAERHSLSGSWMREHRFVMQEVIGRPLLGTESVHHKNLDRSDNRIENLQLRQGAHGTGAAVQCGDCGSQNVIYVALAEPEEA